MDGGAAGGRAGGRAGNPGLPQFLSHLDDERHPPYTTCPTSGSRRVCAATPEHGGALLHGRARSATATARLDCQLLRASGASFHYLLDRFPSMRAAIERIDTARQDGGPLRTGS